MREFFYPIPLPLVAFVFVVSLLLGVILCLPHAWADKFFKAMFRFFGTKDR